MSDYCERCELTLGENGHDPCLETLPGVKFACCGHGGFGYIKFKNGTTLFFTRIYRIEHGEKIIVPLAKELVPDSFLSPNK